MVFPPKVIHWYQNSHAKIKNTKATIWFRLENTSCPHFEIPLDLELCAQGLSKLFVLFELMFVVYKNSKSESIFAVS